MSDEVRTALLKTVSSGFRSDELREVVGAIDTSNPEDPAVVATRDGFWWYRQSMFSQELRDCYSGEQFDALIDDIQLVGKHLRVDVAWMLKRVYVAQLEFEALDPTSEDPALEERWREERASERDISDMFDSLRSHRV